MRYAGYLVRFFKRKTTWFALAVGVLVGVFFGWHLPISPRLELAVDLDHYEGLAFSRDGKHLAITLEKSTIQLWDLDQQKKTADITIPIPFRVPVEPSSAFSPDGTTFWTYFLGNIRSWDLLRGEEIAEPKENHFDQFFDGWSQLVTDSKGDLFVLFTKEPVYQVWDFDSEQEVCCIPRWDRKSPSKIFSGGIIIRQGNTIVVRDFPYLTVRGRVQLPAKDKRFGLKRPSRIEIARGYGFPEMLDPNFALTPDCQTLVFVDGKIHIWDVASGKERILDRQAIERPSISPDGKTLAVQIKKWAREDTWFDKVEDYLGIGSKPKKGEKAVILYDLSSGDEAGFIADATFPRFFPDGKILAVLQDRSLHIYDIPLRKPFGKILLFALLGATPFLLLGQAAALWRRRRQPK